MKSLKILLFPVAIVACSSYAKDPVTNFVQAIHFGAQRCQSMNSARDFMDLIKDDVMVLTPHEALLAFNEKVEGQDAISRSMSKSKYDQCKAYSEELLQAKRNIVIAASISEARGLTLQQITAKVENDELFRQKLNDAFVRSQEE